jgi:2'-5' RNA ligase
MSDDPREPLRAFVAIHLPSERASRLAEYQQELNRKLPAKAVRWTRPDQIHLTLKFFGAVRRDRVPDLQSALRRACGRAQPFELEAAGLGCFPNWRRPRVFWIGLAGAVSALEQLRSDVERETEAWGETEARAFHPHLTIGRVPEAGRHATRCWEELRAEPDRVLFGRWRVEQLELMQSRLAPEGATYSSLAVLPLGRI